MALGHSTTVPANKNYKENPPESVEKLSSILWSTVTATFPYIEEINAWMGKAVNIR